MKKFAITILLLIIPCLVFAQETVRTWTSKTGKTIEATWLSGKDSDPDVIYLLKKGKQYKVPLEKLSDADKKYVMDARKRKAQRGTEGYSDLVLVDETPKPLTVGGFTLPTVRKYAVLVGVTDYSEMNNLTCCVKDVHAIREQLLKLGFKENDIYMLESGRPARELPTKKNILERLDLVLDQVKLGDMVFFAFAGHGAENASGAYICPMETEDDNLSETAVSIPLIMEKLDASKAGFKWLVVDACRNNPFRNRVSGVSSLQRIDDPPKGLLLLQSCGQDEFSSEDSDQGHGLFTASFVEALSGAADQDKNGVLTLMEVCTYTTETTNRRSLELFQKYQRPYFNGDVTDFVLHEDLNRPKADALFAEAQKLFNEEKYEAAKTKISEAMKMYPKEQKYANLGGTIDRFLELIKEKAEAERKAKEAETEAERLAKLGLSPLVSSSSSQKAGERMVKTVNGVEFAFRFCPAGSFMMGSPKSEEYRNDDETPHEVTLTQGFWMLETEVTQEQWQAIMGNNNPSNFKGKNLPVECGSWNDCEEFCEKFNAASSLKIDFPTEAQWEYACRAGTTGAYAGNLDEMGWYYSNSGSETHEVGQKQPNAWGLYDMHGNVYEWCLDWYDENYYAASPTSDPLNSKKGANRVYRGGSWSSRARDCRSAYRNDFTPDNRGNSLGFRPLLVLSCPGSGS